MFGKQYPARIERAMLNIIRVKKEERRAVSAVLAYDFTDGLADAIGGDASALQEILGRGGEMPSKLAGCRLHLDTKTVAVTMVAADNSGDSISVDNTSSITARAMAPTAEGAMSPSLLVKITWPLDDEGLDVDFLRRHLSEQVGVRMDRKQSELNFDGDGDGDEE